MNRLLFVAVLLPGCALLLGPAVEACGPNPIKLSCPVAGLGKDVQPDCCPKTPFTYWYKIYCARQVTLKSASVKYQGGKVYFCCDSCVPLFKKSPEKFAANVNFQLFASRQARQVRCPLCGGDLKVPEAITVGGAKVDVCSAACKKKLEEATPGERLWLAFGDAAFDRGFVVKKNRTAPELGCCCQP